MMIVRLYPDTVAAHVSQIYAGLYDLMARGELELRLTRQLRRQPRASREFTVWAEVEVPGEDLIRTACFDMADGGDILSTDGLERGDFYFKRSLDPGVVGHLPPALKKKMRPYGLNYACRSIHQWGTLRRIALYNQIHGGSFIEPTKLVRSLKSPLRHWLANRISRRLFEDPVPFSTSFEISPSAPAEPLILFQTRLWTPHEMYSDVNDRRIEIVRALKSHFGRQFLGGIVRTPFARKYCPDCLSDEPTNKSGYLGLVRRSLIAVTTTGLHRSIGWRFPECLAASRCIVSEPLRYVLPVPPVEGEHYLVFDSAEQCIAACHRYLDEPDFARGVRERSFAYYEREVRPESIMGRCLREVRAGVAAGGSDRD